MTELEFGERLKQYRKARGLTQQELADLLGGVQQIRLPVGERQLSPTWPPWAPWPTPWG